MRIRQCSCGKHLTTKDVVNEGQADGVLYLTCKYCKSTLAVLSKKVRALIRGVA